MTTGGEDIVIYDARYREVGSIPYAMRETDTSLFRRINKELTRLGLDPKGYPLVDMMDEDSMKFHALREDILEFNAVRERIKHELGIVDE